MKKTHLKSTPMKIVLALLVLLLLWSAFGYFFSRVEQMEYQVIEKKPNYEIRLYPKHLVAQTMVEGPYRESLNEGFTIVAGYIFGGNRKKEKIAMTAPVTQQEEVSEKIAMTAPVLTSRENEARIVSFGMPKGYTLENLPEPTDPRVKIVEIEEKTFAALRFSWFRSEARVRKMEEKLLSSLEKDGLTPKGSPIYAGYNGPGTPPWMMRNEVLVEVEGQ